MDSATGMADEQEVREDPPLLGPSARAFGKAALVAYWIACLAVIVFGLVQLDWGQMDWGRPPPKPAPAVATKPTAPVRPIAPHAPPQAAPRVAPRAAPPPERAVAPDGLPQSSWAVVALAVVSLIGLLLLVLRPRRRRGLRDRGRFSGRRHRLGSIL
jgi:hypothetical protein